MWPSLLYAKFCACPREPLLGAQLDRPTDTPGSEAETAKKKVMELAVEMPSEAEKMEQSGFSRYIGHVTPLMKKTPSLVCASRMKVATSCAALLLFAAGLALQVPAGSARSVGWLVHYMPATLTAPLIGAAHA